MKQFFEKAMYSRVSLLGITIVIFSLGLGAICSRSTSPYDELLDNGFYAYLIPEQELEKYGWKLTPIQEDWDAHCFGGPSSPWNPLTIIYRDSADQTQLTITISDRDVLWNREMPVETIELDSSWAKVGTATTYQGDPFSPVKFNDPWGNEVVVDGWLPIADKIKIVNSLEYIGPPVKDVINPWSAEWCESQK